MELTKNELAKAIGASVQTVNGWMRNGLPNRKRDGNGTRKVVVFDVVEAAEWFLENGKAKYLVALDEFLPDRAAADPGSPQPSKLTVLQMAKRIVDDTWRDYEAGHLEAFIVCAECP